MKLFINALTHLDASLWTPQQGLTGGSWLVDLELSAPQAEDGMILDFGLVKPWAKKLLDEGADHTLLLPAHNRHLHLESLPNKRLRVSCEQPYFMLLEAPEEAFTLLPLEEITEAELAAWLSESLNQQLPLSQGQASLQLRQEQLGAQPEIHYSHGLRLHDGNCQRIAHGHRSKLEVFCNGEADLSSARKLAERWNHAYLFDQADLIRRANGCVVIGYQAPQGQFQITLPETLAFCLPGPTTVENLTCFLFQQLKQEHPEQHWEVRMYEGINKGAVVEG